MSSKVKRKLCYIKLSATIDEIDYASHIFKATIWVSMNYEDVNGADIPGIELGTPGSDLLKPCTIEDNGINIPVNPKIMFSNQVDLTNIGDPKALYNPNTNVVSYDIGVYATLKFNVDLKQFPFDRCALELPLNVRTSAFAYLSNCPTEWLPEKYNYRSPFSITVSSRVAAEYDVSKSKPILIMIKRFRPTMIILLERNPTHWIQVAIIPTFLIVLLSYQVFAVIPYDDLSSRANFIVTLVLTQVALKFAILNGLPVVPYNTLMDTYLIASITMLITIGIVCTLSNGDMFDLIGGLCTSGLWILFHFVFFILSVCEKLDIFRVSLDSFIDSLKGTAVLQQYQLKDFANQVINCDEKKS
jgi:hypothetical protein